MTSAPREPRLASPTSGKPTCATLPLGRFHPRQRDSRASTPATRLASARSSNTSPTASLTQTRTLKASRPFAWFVSASVGSRSNDLEELASRARVHPRLTLRKQDSSRAATKGASTYKDCSRVLKVEPTVAMRKETSARLRREELVVTL